MGEIPISQRERQAGLGDTWLSATYYLTPRKSDALFIDFTGKLKWASGDEVKGLSTGTTDTELRVDTFKRFDSITLNSGIGYRWRNGNVAYNNSINGIVGVDLRWAPGVNIGINLTAAESATTTAGGPREWLIYWSAKQPTNTRWTLYALRGQSTISPDIGVGLTMTRTFSQR